MSWMVKIQLSGSLRRPPIPLPVVGHVTDTNPCQSGARPTKATADRLLHLQQKKRRKKTNNIDNINQSIEI